MRLHQYLWCIHAPLWLHGFGLRSCSPYHLNLACGSVLQHPCQPKHRHPSVHFLFKISPVPVGLPCLTGEPSDKGRGLGVWRGGLGRKWKRAGDQKTKIFMMAQRKGGGWVAWVRVLHNDTTTGWEIGGEDVSVWVSWGVVFVGLGGHNITDL